ncbi:hypothetical protein M271_04205 [Streptomyces rapamycinicus NRRL 5491]|uniref:Uncharacterized protein n=3 Tax=Streptomyces violaceusniger group TaxID=2839105 RepID=A0A0A0NDH6_STRRN|nr:hypothetical protein M271_04205 [Streptomyces rapamycinicus NRRL 5491]MBB4779938.1 hypothetical protein [Streptomyces rapamycinicus]MBP2066353.1 hypothetical protein [Streptomyces iranensis]RLV75407.1 hypothetical protein D3C57_139315 [Streptomyces rapamycinicus NRRL 5491]CDR02854.1 predicted protein [Streptomyces iranensis]
MFRTLFTLLLGAAIAVGIPLATKRVARTTMTQVHRINQ